VVATETGGGFTLDGVAMFVPYAAAADDLLVTARVGEDANQLATFLLDAATPGITVEPQDVIGPDRRHRVRFADVRTSEAELLGEIGGGQAIVETIDNYGAAATCAEMIGGAQRVLELTVEYAGQRVQFGRPIGSFQAVAHHCADMAADVLGSRFIGYEAIWRLSEALDPPAEISLAVSAAKAWVSDAYQRVCALGQQVHGAIGFTEEHDLHLFLSHAMAAALSFGDGDFHTDRVAGAIGLPTDQAPVHEPGGVD
jgi:alkylation response protein AidB-like acyl-CoA dehydrogenase